MDSQPFALTPLRVIWGVMTGAPILYAVLAFMVRADRRLMSFPDFSKPLELMLTVFALFSVTAAYVVPRLIASKRSVDPSARSAMTNEELAAAAKMPLIRRWANYDAAAVAGLIMTLSGSPSSRVVPFAVVSFTLLLFSYPTRERMEGALY